MGFSLGHFIGGAAAAGVSNADEAIKHRDALDLQAHQDDAAMMRQTALANLQQEHAIALAQNSSDISAQATTNARNLQTSDIAEDAQRLANERVAPGNGIIHSNMQAALDDYEKSDLPEDQKQLGRDAINKYLADNIQEATPTDMEQLHASVNMGYTKGTELLTMQQANVSALAAARKQDYLDLKEDHKNTNDANRIEMQDRHYQGSIAAILSKQKASGDDEDTATIKTAKVIQADEKTRGNEISIAQAIDLTKKASDAGNNYAIQFARVAADAGQVGKSKTYPTASDAIAAGREDFVAPRSNPKAQTPAPHAPIATLPAGAVKVGTSGGKDVYKLPNGQQMVQQ